MFQEYFARPWWLVLLLLAPAVYLLARRSLSGLPPVRRAFAVGLRTLVVVLLALAAAELRWVKKNDRLAVIFAVDVSASVPPEHRQAALDFVKRSAQARDVRRGDFVGLVVFGKNAGIEVSPRAAALSFEGLNTLIERDFTDLQSAIRLAVAVFPEGAARRLVILSDGNENRGQALEEARAAREQGVEIDVLPISYDYPSEVLVDKVVVDPAVHRGEPFDVRVIVEATRAGRATLRLFQNQVQLKAQEVDLRPGKNVFVFPQRQDADGHYAYQAIIEPLTQDDDAILQNNSAEAFTAIRGLPKVLLCSADPAGDGPLLQALREEQINVTVVRPEGLPGEMEEFLGYDAVLFSNVPAHQLSDDRKKMFESLVKAVGLGFVMLGGEDSFGAGGYLGTPIEELLPVSMDVQQKKILPNGALAIVMHSCEINNGNYWAKETVKKAIQVLSPRDYAGVLYYGGMGQEQWLFQMTQVKDRNRMLNALSGFTPGDMPDFSRIVQLAYTSLTKTPASIKHIIILSDGDPNMPSPAQIQAIRQANITISTICMGWHSSPANMKQLARDGGGKYYELADPQQLPSIFIREASTVRKSLISERDFRPVPASAGSFLRGIDLSAIPPLKGYVITTRKESAEEMLAAPPVEGDPIFDPILARWAYGLGKSVAFTSDAGRRWGVHWPAWENYRKFWGQLVRWVSRQGSDQGLRASRSLEDEAGVVTLDAMDEAGNFLNGLLLDGAVVDPDYRSAPVEVRQVAPGRYRAQFPVGRKGTYLVNLRYDRDGVSYSYTTGLTVPYSSEFRRLSTNQDLLGRLAAAAQGKMIDPEKPNSVFARDFAPGRSSQDLWRGLVQAAAALFFLDIFVRRVALDYRKVLAACAAAFGRVFSRRRPAATPADERLGALLARKSAVLTARGEGRRFYEPAGGTAPPVDPSFIAGSAPAAPGDRAAEKAAEKAAGKPRPPEPPPAPAPTEAESYTARLLAAKKRAMDRK